MAKDNNTPASAGVTQEELEAQRLATEAKAKEESEKALADAKAKEESEKALADAKAKEESEVSEVFAVNDKKYMLSNRCPEKLQFNGVVYSRKELLTNDEILQSLVIGESPFVKKV